MIKGIIFDFINTLYDPEKKQLFTGVLSLLKDLKTSGIKLGLLSYGSAGKIELIRKLGLNEYFDKVAVTEEKSPAEFQLFLEQFKLNPDQILVVGDRLDDEIKTGKSLGLITVWISPQPNITRTKFADFQIRSVTEVITFI